MPNVVRPIVLTIALCTPMAASAQQPPTTQTTPRVAADSAPRSAQQLAERYRRAHARQDVEAIKRLFYWDGSTARTRMAVESYITQDVSHAIRGVDVIPLDSADVTHYVQDGVTYRMTVPPVAKLRVDFLPRTAHGVRYNQEQSIYFIGVREGYYWLVTAVPVAR